MHGPTIITFILCHTSVPISKAVDGQSVCSHTLLSVLVNILEILLRVELLRGDLLPTGAGRVTDPAAGWSSSIDVDLVGGLLLGNGGGEEESFTFLDTG